MSDQAFLRHLMLRIEDRYTPCRSSGVVRSRSGINPSAQVGSSVRNLRKYGVAGPELGGCLEAKANELFDGGADQPEESTSREFCPNTCPGFPC